MRARSYHSHKRTLTLLLHPTDYSNIMFCVPNVSLYIVRCPRRLSYNRCQLAAEQYPPYVARKHISVRCGKPAVSKLLTLMIRLLSSNLIPGPPNSCRPRTVAISVLSRYYIWIAISHATIMCDRSAQYRSRNEHLRQRNHGSLTEKYSLIGICLL
jgi:hypothetical protein